MDFDPADLPLDRFRTYRLVKLTGWSLNAIDDTPAATLDWLLACDAAAGRAQASAQARAAKG